MARFFDDASNERLELNSAILTSTPISMSAWFATDDLTIQEVFLVLHNNDVPVDGFILEFRGDVAGNFVRASVSLASATQEAISTLGVSDNNWHNAVAVFTNSTSRAVYLDGGNKGTDTNNMTPGTIDFTNIGVLDYGAGVAGEMSGALAEIGLWNVALTDEDAAILGNRYSPLFVKPQNLVSYWILKRDEDRDKITGVVMTPINTPTIAEHPPMIYPADIDIPTILAIAEEEMHGGFVDIMKVLRPLFPIRQSRL